MFKIRYMAASLLLLTAFSGTVVAQNRDHQDLFRTWMEGQRSSFAGLASFRMHADVRHVVSTRSGERVAEMGFDFSRGDDESRPGREMTFFTLDGDTLDVSERRRVERSLSFLMTPEIGPLLTGFHLPVQLLSRVRPVAEPMEVEIDGIRLVRYELRIAPPNRDQSGGGRPGGGRPGGGQPGVRPPQGPPIGGGRRPPFGAPPPRGQRPGENGFEAPEQRVTIWIDAESATLVRSQLQIRMPGDRALVSESVYARMGGIDLPISRVVSGSFPMQRRLRTVTVALHHETTFSGFEIATK